jgi:hypothetical protein
MIVGGQTNAGASSRALAQSTLFWHPESHQWTSGNDTAQGHTDHQAFLLPGGDVLVGGGFDEQGPFDGDYKKSSAEVLYLELWDHSTGSWSYAGSITPGGSALTALPNGSVLFYELRERNEMAVWSRVSESGQLNHQSAESTEPVILEWPSGPRNKNDPLYFLTASHADVDINDLTGYRRHWIVALFIVLIAIFFIAWKMRRSHIRRTGPR